MGTAENDETEIGQRFRGTWSGPAVTTTSSAETETETEDIAQGLGIDTSDEQAEAGRANEKGTVSGSHRRRVNVIGKETSIDNGMTTTAAEADVGTIETRTTNMTSEEEIAVGPGIGTGEGKVKMELRSPHDRVGLGLHRHAREGGHDRRPDIEELIRRIFPCELSNLGPLQMLTTVLSSREAL
ncbi:MAG: hypothetical protein M1815_001916 [Lichina confinis]|nr:MAG: hypothetical protein M1815_001916 [Lichina confinis]